MLEQISAKMNEKSVQGTSKWNDKGHLPKTDERYWRERVFLPLYTGTGEEKRTSGLYAVKIQYRGRRATFTLGVADKIGAAAKAKQIYLALITEGWEATLANFRPDYAPTPKEELVTVGRYIEAARAASGVGARTFEDYARSFRRMVADINRIESELTLEPKKVGKRGRKPKPKVINTKFAAISGRRKLWLSEIEAVPLSDITPDAIGRWITDYVTRAAGDPAKQRAAKISANSYLRQARSLFGRKVLKHVSKSLVLPETLPFEGIEPLPRVSMRYHSKVDPEELLRTAAKELEGNTNKREAFKILVLALCAGLRAGEIDALRWENVDFRLGLVRVETSAYFKPKAETSIGAIELEPEIVELLRGWHGKARSEFVIESDRPFRQSLSYVRRRACDQFKALTTWLRANGVDGKRPVHTLRKEFGSLVAKRFGLHAASLALRHADIKTTASFYLDRKERVVVGLGKVLSGGGKQVGEFTPTPKDAQVEEPAEREKPRMDERG